MWKEDPNQETCKPSSAVNEPGRASENILAFENSAAPAPRVPTAKRGVLILVVFFLLQILAGVLIGIFLSVQYAVSGGDLSDPAAVSANIETYAMQVNLLASYLASIVMVVWLWRKVKNPMDGFTYQFLGLQRCSLASLRRPAAVGLGLGFGYLLIGGLLFPEPVGTGFGPLTTLSMSSGSGLVLWIITALLFAPVIEELLFRGILLKCLLQSWPTPPAAYVAIAASIAVFTAFHVQEFVFFPFAAVAIFTMAAAASYFRLKNDSLVAAWAVHFCYNLALVIALLASRLAPAV